MPLLFTLCVAKTDSLSVLKMVIKIKSKYRMVFDYKGRTLVRSAELGMISVGPQREKT